MKLEQICKIRNIKSDYIKTPMVVPSFSSKGFIDIDNIHRMLNKYIINSKLISAYDLYYKNISSEDIYGSEILFLDSGGYESKNYFQTSNIFISEYKTLEWNENKYEDVIRNIKPISDIIIINYDFEKDKTENQILFAQRLFSNYDYLYKDFLIKPDDSKGMINIEEYIANIEKLSTFDILGFTEKELGESIKQRLENLLKIRVALINLEIDKPIHILGCLDPISIWLYFLFGADIFDGLSWLRYAYSETGEAIYNSNNNLLKYCEYNLYESNLMMYYSNIKYLQNLNFEMNKFCYNYNFDNIKIKKPYISIIQDLLKEFNLI